MPIGGDPMWAALTQHTRRTEEHPGGSEVASLTQPHIQQIAGKSYLSMSPDPISITFASLADPTRHSCAPGLGSASVTELAAPFDMSMPAISQHLKVLENAGLIERGREVQWRPCKLSAGPLKEAVDWLEHYRPFWEESFDRLTEYLREVQRKEKKHGRKK